MKRCSNVHRFRVSTVTLDGPAVSCVCGGWVVSLEPQGMVFITPESTLTIPYDGYTATLDEAEA